MLLFNLCVCFYFFFFFFCFLFLSMFFCFVFCLFFGHLHLRRTVLVSVADQTHVQDWPKLTSRIDQSSRPGLTKATSRTAWPGNWPASWFWLRVVAWLRCLLNAGQRRCWPLSHSCTVQPARYELWPHRQWQLTWATATCFTTSTTFCRLRRLRRRRYTSCVISLLRLWARWTTGYSVWTPVC